jgi:hypothetical protein
MKKPLSQLLDEARGAAPEAAAPPLPAGFAARVVARWQAGQSADEGIATLVRIWTRTCLAGACLALLSATFIHFKTTRNARASAASAWVLIAAETEPE